MNENRGPLSGVSVLDVGTYVAGPYAAALLGEFGASVLKIEPPGGEFLRAYAATRPHWFHECNRNKQSLVLDLKSPDGQARFGELVGGADLVLHNLHPGAARKLALDYENLTRWNPAIIAVQISAFGATGPDAHRRGTATTIDASSGLASLAGYPGGGPLRPANLYGDMVTASFGAMAAMAALRFRDRTGRGQYIDLAMMEATVHLLGTELARVSAGARTGRTGGNNRPDQVPHDCYRCAGDDTWIAIAVESDEEWQNLVRALGSPQWASGPELATATGRLAQRERIDEHITAWTSAREPQAACGQLRAAGIRCGVVLPPGGLLSDPQLGFRQFFEYLDLGQAGLAPIPRTAFARSQPDYPASRPAPRLDDGADQLPHLPRQDAPKS
jgi:crotonobetainyl-CoA:carnitine CoA-transferase CaiB-like acyl-CoA transferase